MPPSDGVDEVAAAAVSDDDGSQKKKKQLPYHVVIAGQTKV